MHVFFGEGGAVFPTDVHFFGHVNGVERGTWQGGVFINALVGSGTIGPSSVPGSKETVLHISLLGNGNRLSTLSHFFVRYLWFMRKRSIPIVGDVRPVRPHQLDRPQAVGGLTLEQAVRCPEYGAPLVVLGAPLTIDADAFKTASGDLESSLRLICQKVHAYGEVKVGR